jgi:hypothetical protein
VTDVALATSVSLARLERALLMMERSEISVIWNGAGLSRRWRLPWSARDLVMEVVLGPMTEIRFETGELHLPPGALVTASRKDPALLVAISRTGLRELLLLPIRI